MQKKLTRREFMGKTAGIGTLAAIGCSKSSPAPVQTPVKAPAPFPSDNGVQLAVARWKGATDGEQAIGQAAKRLTEVAIEQLGGMARFVPKGATVWVKPNINFHRTVEFAANTHPEVVATVCRLCFEAGAGKVRVGDHSFFGATTSYPMSGIEAAVKRVGAEMVYLDESKFREFAIGGRLLDKWLLCPEIVEADILINVPVAKGHPLPKYSGCMKNLMGVAGADRSKWHEDITGYLCDFNTFLKPHLNVVDIVRAIVSGPPRGGSLDDVRYFGVVAAGVDRIALDALGAEVIGVDPAEVQTITGGAQCGLGTANYRTLAPPDIVVQG